MDKKQSERRERIAEVVGEMVVGAARAVGDGSIVELVSLLCYIRFGWRPVSVAGKLYRLDDGTMVPVTRGEMIQAVGTESADALAAAIVEATCPTP